MIGTSAAHCQMANGIIINPYTTFFLLFMLPRGLIAARPKKTRRLHDSIYFGILYIPGTL